MLSPIRPRIRPLVVLTLALAAVLGGCGETTSESATESVVHSYTVRGVVRALPDPTRQGTDLYVQHEAIPDFVDDRGESVGMNSMTMPFPVVDPAVLDGVAVGDRVTMRFEVEWDGSPPLRVLELEPLPDGTVLDFESVPDEADDTDEASADETVHDEHDGHEPPEPVGPGQESS